MFQKSFSSKLIIFPLLALVIVSPIIKAASANAATKSVSLSKIKQSVKLKDRRKNSFLCVNIRGKKRAGVSKKGYFIFDDPVISKLKKQLRKTRNSRAKASLKKQLSVLEARKRQCNGISFRKPSASATLATGRGVDPIAIRMEGSSGITSAPMRCQKVSDPVGATIALFDEQNCTALVRPDSHRISQASFQFRVIRSGDGARSDPATVTINWDQSGEFLGDQLSLAKYKVSLSEAEATKLVMQAGLGANRDELVAIGMGPNGLDALLDRLFAPGNPAACAAAEAKAMEIAFPYTEPLCFDYNDLHPDGGVDSQGRPIRDTVTYCATKDLDQGLYRWNIRALSNYWLYHLTNGCEPLRERMALFYHNHFAVNLSSFGGNTDRRSLYKKLHLDLLRGKTPEADNALVAPFDLLVSRMHGADGAMLWWLNNNINSRTDGSGRGNENYARELQELFTLGKDPVTGATRYTEEDVYQMTYSVMGYADELQSEAEAPMVQISCSPSSEPSCGRGAFPASRGTFNQVFKTKFYDTRWSSSPTRPEYKRLFAGTPWERTDTFKANVFAPGEDTVTPYLLNAHPGVSQYLATRLIATFATVEPTVEMVTLVANDLRGNQWRVEPALRRIFASSSFFSEASRNDAVSSPVESIVSFARALDLPFIRTTYGANQTLNMVNSLRDRLSEAGQVPGEPVTVFGWLEAGKITGGKLHTGTSFAAEQFALGRSRIVSQLLNDLDFARRTIPEYATPLRWERFLDASAPRSPEALLDGLTRKLGLAISAEQRSALLEYLKKLSLESEIPPGDLSRPKASAVIDIDWASLDTARFDALVRMKVPGLIEILWALVDAQTK